MKHARPTESGNVIFFILLGVILIGLVTAAIRSGGKHAAHIDKEEVLLLATRIRQHATDVDRAVTQIMSEGASQVDIRFAHPDAHADYGDIDTTPYVQVFHVQGGGADYKAAPDGSQVTATNWEFYGDTHMPDVGTSKAELIALLPNVTQAVCEKINEMNGYTAQPEDTGTCLYDSSSPDTARFDAGTQFAGTPGTLDESSFSRTPAMQACVTCSGSPDTYHFYHVLHVR